MAAPDWGCFRPIGGNRGGGGTNSINNQPRLNLPCEGGNDPQQNRFGIDGFATPRSRHRGGVNVLFCDGRVQFVDETIESRISSTVAFTDLNGNGIRDSNEAENYGVWQRLAWIDEGLTVTPP